MAHLPSRNFHERPLVEDHTDTRAVLSMLLNRCGCRTIVAKNGADARTRLSEMRFDVLISDLGTPSTAPGVRLRGSGRAC